MAMSNRQADRELYDRIWSLGAQAVRDNRISELTYVTLTTPSLEEYQNSRGARMSDLIRVVQLGILQLRGSGELNGS
ncbi:hypothetical protein FHX15_005078 [Rhizobium sp. BK650]|uniref:hypothetical protein n=1 Tax=Rhizobium sp. BK650 TaxID=2586990 RepID=UPI00162004A7|nr:hypothetical protein [Rhizobium sp. BK650]MBB3659810.1 hypothetical protein [Rhizobium sp. BK650]